MGFIIHSSLPFRQWRQTGLLIAQVVCAQAQQKASTFVEVVYAIIQCWKHCAGVGMRGMKPRVSRQKASQQHGAHGSRNTGQSGTSGG